MFSTLYGQTAAALYAKAAGQNAQARQLYNASADTYYKANDAAAYDDWVRARNHWDYFYNRCASLLGPLSRALLVRNRRGSALCCAKTAMWCNSIPGPQLPLTPFHPPLQLVNCPHGNERLVTSRQSSVRSHAG